MILLGIVLVVIGWLIHLSILMTLGVILIVVGLILWVVGAMGHPVGGRSHWYQPTCRIRSCDLTGRSLQ